MIITDHFVMLNFPKTGTTFAREAVKAVYGQKEGRPWQWAARFGLYRPPVQELLLPKLYGTEPAGYIDQHGIYQQIPVEHASKQVVSIIRNPLEKFISSYVFEWWRKHPSEEMRAHPKFPDLSLADYFDFSATQGSHGLGPATFAFIRFYSPDPAKVAQRVHAGESLEENVPPITFLRQETLREDLLRFLEGLGIPHTRRMNHIPDRNVGAGDKKSRIDEEHIRHAARGLLEIEAPLLNMFPDYRQEITQRALG